VQRTSPAQTSGQLRYGVQLIESAAEYDVDIAHYFIALGHAHLSSSRLEVSLLDKFIYRVAIDHFSQDR